MHNIAIEYLGPIRNANINLGDLTLFVGSHVSGKSILLQMFKLLVDKGHIRRTTEQYGFIWGNSVEAPCGPVSPFLQEKKITSPRLTINMIFKTFI